MRLLQNLREDLPDITPRRFLRHPAVKSYLHQKFPKIISPTLSDLHVSLANRSHLRAFILQVKEQCFPAGTGWEGLWFRSRFKYYFLIKKYIAILRLKRTQDVEIALKDHYIRYAAEIAKDSVIAHDEDDPEDSESDPLRILICMSQRSSQRLIRAQYLQSDIGFKRVVGFQEFELAGLDRDANTSPYLSHLYLGHDLLIPPYPGVIFCRVFLNRQSAFAHFIVFQQIDKIVQLDTGQNLRWRHLHAESLEDYDGKILQWAVDQHGGQAKGAFRSILRYIILIT
jgi:hypothetical protein